MSTQQKALLVRLEGRRVHGLDELNLALGRGWRVALATPLGGTVAGTDEVPPGLATLVVLERPVDAAAEVLEALEEQAEPLLEESLRDEPLLDVGDGSSRALPPDPADDPDA